MNLIIKIRQIKREVSRKKKLEKRQSKSKSIAGNTHKIKEPAALQPPEESKRKQRTKSEGEC